METPGTAGGNGPGSLRPVAKQPEAILATRYTNLKNGKVSS